MNTSLDPVRLSKVKAAYTTGHVPPEALTALTDEARPAAGDLVLARVTEIGQHTRLEAPSGRKARLFPGDEVLVCYGNRYAPDQFEAVVPDDLGPCHLVAAGGIAATALSWHADLEAPTALEPIGLVRSGNGTVLNLRQWRLPQLPVDAPRPWTVAVLGTSMNAGKTTAAAGIVRGLRETGRRVGGAKVTGTGAGGDAWLLGDAGAHPVLDFTAVGFASTYRCTPAEVLTSLRTLCGHLADANVEVAVLEVADGLLQAETAALVADPEFAAHVDAVVFAAGDAVGAIAGVERLRALDLPVVAVSGCLTCSPLATREASAALDIPVLGLDDLWAGHATLTPRISSGVGEAMAGVVATGDPHGGGRAA